MVVFGMNVSDDSISIWIIMVIDSAEHKFDQPVESN